MTEKTIDKLFPFSQTLSFDEFDKKFRETEDNN